MVKSILCLIRRYSGWLFVALIVATSILSLIPISGPATGNDKIDHVIGYFALLFLWGLSSWRPKLWLKATIVLFYGLLVEVAQYFFPHRSFSLADWLADAIGILLAIVLILAVNYVARKTK